MHPPRAVIKVNGLQVNSLEGHSRFCWNHTEGLFSRWWDEFDVERGDAVFEANVEPVESVGLGVVPGALPVCGGVPCDAFDTFPHALWRKGS